MKLPPRPEPLVTPPPNTRSWMGTEDAGGQGLNAARTVDGEYNFVDPRYIDKAVSMARWVVAALALMVLHAPTKFQVVSYQIESGNGFRSYALLSQSSILRAIAAVSLSTAMIECDALHRLLYAIWEGMKSVPTRANQPPISKGRAVQVAFSVILRFAETISFFETDHGAFAVVKAVRNLLGCTALCSFAALSASYHSGEVRSRSPKFRRPRHRRDRLDASCDDLSMNAGPAKARGLLESPERGLIERCGRFYLWSLVHAVQERRRPDADDLAVRLVPGNRLARARRCGLLRLASGDHDVGHGAARRVAAPAVPDLL